MYYFKNIHIYAFIDKKILSKNSYKNEITISLYMFKMI